MKRIRIGIDARLLYQTGVGVYIRNLIFELSKIDKQDVHYIVFAKKDEYDRFVSEYAPSTSNLEHRTCNVSWHSFSEQLIYVWQLYVANLDLMHFPYFSWPVLYLKPFVATVHDTILLQFATGKASTLHLFVYKLKQLVFRFVFGQQISRAKKIFVPSNVVAYELNKYYPSAKAKIVVTHEGVDQVFAKSVSQKPENFKYKENSYFLYVGNTYPHKNVEMLLTAFNKIKEQNSNSQSNIANSNEKNEIQLVLAGPRSVFSEKLKEKYKMLGNIAIWMHKVKTSELKWLYSNAKALVFPSIAEGFGLPIVEAVSVGCPLILSDIPVFREVADNGATFFDSGSIDSLVSALTKDISISHDKIIREPNQYLSFEQMTKTTAENYLH